MFASLISDYIPKDLRGTGFGLYSLISSVSMIFASLIAGHISESFGMNVAFISGAILGIITIVILLFIKPFLSIDKNDEQTV